MKNKQIPYIDQLLELGKLYKVDEIKLYAKSKKKLTTSQIELILLKNKIRLPEQSYNKKKIAEIKFKEQVLTNILITLFLITFVISLISVRPFIKTVTNEIKFTYVAKEYKSNFNNDDYKKSCQLLFKFDLPSLNIDNKDIFINFVKNDKKFRGENIRFILLDEIGKSRISEDISFDQIKESLSVLWS